jgi:probable HAF family extracellular repeat protein
MGLARSRYRRKWIWSVDRISTDLQLIERVHFDARADNASWFEFMGSDYTTLGIQPVALSMGDQRRRCSGWVGRKQRERWAFLAPKPYSAASNLGTLGGQSSLGFALNNARWVVGTSDTATNVAAFLYDGTKMIDLNTTLVNGAGWQLTSARAINDYNQIVGAGFHNGQSRAYLLNPVLSNRPGLGIVPCVLPPIATVGSAKD